MSDLHRAWQTFKVAGDALVAALEETMLDAAPRPPAASRVTSPGARPPKPSGVVMPSPLTPAKAQKAQLSPEKRQESLKALTPIAVRIITMVGAEHPQLRATVQGQAALERIAFDDATIDAAIQAAKGLS